MVAISGDPEDKLAILANRMPGIRFLRDPEIRVADLYGVRDPGNRGPGDVPLARPATFLVDREGQVAWRVLTDNWRIRPRADDVIARIRALP